MERSSHEIMNRSQSAHSISCALWAMQVFSTRRNEVGHN